MAVIRGLGRARIFDKRGDAQRGLLGARVHEGERMVVAVGRQLVEVDRVSERRGGPVAQEKRVASPVGPGDAGNPQVAGSHGLVQGRVGQRGGLRDAGGGWYAGQPRGVGAAVGGDAVGRGLDVESGEADVFDVALVGAKRLHQSVDLVHERGVPALKMSAE